LIENMNLTLLIRNQSSALKISLRRGHRYSFYQEGANIKSAIEGKYVKRWVFYKPCDIGA